jgi:hypothetical protein
MARIARHLSYANVTASLALFVALSGISWAAVALPRNSVGTKQLKKNAVTGPKIKGNAVTSAKVRNGSLLAADFMRPLGRAAVVPAARTGAFAVADGSGRVVIGPHGFLRRNGEWGGRRPFGSSS